MVIQYMSGDIGHHENIPHSTKRRCLLGYSKARQWEYPEAEHDYNPYWDYEPDSGVDEKLKQYVIS